jgi:hypothetical protein
MADSLASAAAASWPAPSASRTARTPRHPRRARARLPTARIPPTSKPLSRSPTPGQHQQHHGLGPLLRVPSRPFEQWHAHQRADDDEEPNLGVSKEATRIQNL